MNLIITDVGLIDRTQLKVKDIATEDGSARTIATEWYLGDKLVRRDVWVSSFRGMALGVHDGKAA